MISQIPRPTPSTGPRRRRARRGLTGIDHDGLVHGLGEVVRHHPSHDLHDSFQLEINLHHTDSFEVQNGEGLRHASTGPRGGLGEDERLAQFGDDEKNQLEILIRDLEQKFDIDMGVSLDLDGVSGVSPLPVVGLEVGARVAGLDDPDEVVWSEYLAAGARI